MSDLISRDEAIKAIKKRMGNKPLPPTEIYTYFGCIDEIKAIPSAETTGALDDAIAKYVADGLMELPSAEAVQGYTEWLEKIIVMLEPAHLCEDTTDKEWCEKNCNYASIQAECLRHLYEVSKGGDDE